MIHRKWHKRTVRRLLAGVGAGGVLASTGMHACAPAHADAGLSAVQVAYVKMYGATAICPTIDQYHSIPGVIGVVKGVVRDGFTAEQAVEIVNAAVATYCAENYPLLTETGNYFRAQDEAKVLA